MFPSTLRIVYPDDISFVTYLAITEAKQDSNNETLQQKHGSIIWILFVRLEIKNVLGLEEIFVFEFVTFKDVLTW